jgi:hypothetical protein
MADRYPSINDRVRSFIEAQHVFFVGTAAAEGTVNVSPKGNDSLRVTGPNEIVWLNGTGSGNETAAHLLQTNRMTLMWCAFDGNPWIVRTYGPATVVHAGEPEWDSLLGMFPPMLGARQVFRQQVDLVLTSCGFGVPRYSYEGDRDLMEVWARRKGEEGLATYRREKNRVSLDGCPTGLPD